MTTTNLTDNRFVHANDPLFQVVNSHVDQFEGCGGTHELNTYFNLIARARELYGFERGIELVQAVLVENVNPSDFNNFAFSEVNNETAETLIDLIDGWLGTLSIDEIVERLMSKVKELESIGLRGISFNDIEWV